MSQGPDSSKPSEEEITPEEAGSTPEETVEDAVILDEPDDAPAGDEAVAEEPDAELEGDADDAVEQVEEDEPEEVSEDTTTEELEPAGTQSTPPAPATQSRGTALFIGFLLGGVAAAAIGFGAARYVVPDGWPFPGTTPEEDPLPGLVATQGDEISGLTTEIARLDAALTALKADSSAADRADGIAASVEAVNTRLDEIDARLAAVEKLAPEGSAAADAAAEAYDRELTALREMFAGELEKVQSAQADAATLQADAAEAAQAATGRAALSRVLAALDSGQPYAEALDEFATTSGVDIPDALAAPAANGVPTLADLQAGFPEAARDALDAAIRAGVEDGSIGRFEAFLRIQLGTRSLEAKAGADPDAVLSRAEAALRQGDLSAVLTELDALPETAKPALAAWRDLVEMRKAALDAGAALTQDMNAK
ncbi:MAG: hypothetical protein P8X76_01815 [Maritimibacter sp.]